MGDYLSEKQLRESFTQKVKACYAEYLAAWRKLQPQELIERAGEIHTIQQLADDLPESISAEDMAYLVRFKNPLEVVSDAWCDSVSYSLDDEELDHVLWELRDRSNAEGDYEMEPEYYSRDAPELSM